MRALVTGIGGFVGGHLAAGLRDAGFEVCGIDRTPAAVVGAVDGIERSAGDVCDRPFMNRVVKEFRPSHVFHMAWAFDGGGRTSENDAVAASVLFDVVRQSAMNPWVLLASSSAVYGSPQVLPIDEETALAPATAYGVSKVLMEERAAGIHRNHGMNIVVTRTFNLLGPGVPERLLPGSLTAQIVAAENGGPRRIKIGRLDSSRDYLDVRDAVRAYVALAMRSTLTPRVFNVCSGVSRSCGELAEELVAAAAVPVELVQDTSRMQVGDVDFQRGSAARLAHATGWSPKISFARSVGEMLQHVRTAVRLRPPSTRGVTSD